MASEINESGYEDLRQYILDNWSYIELRDDGGSAIVRYEIGADLDFSYDSTASDQTLTITGTVLGSDLETEGETLPVTFGGETVIYAVASGGDEKHSDSDVEFSWNKPADELSITHELEVPQV